MGWNNLVRHLMSAYSELGTLYHGWQSGDKALAILAIHQVRKALDQIEKELGE